MADQTVSAVRHRDRPGAEWPPWRRRLHEILFEADTRAGLVFDIVLICCIILSGLIVLLDSVQSIRVEFGTWLMVGDWFFTILFSLEIVLRLISVRRPFRYATSFFGVVDILAVMPTYLSLLFPGAHQLSIVRMIRVLRIFRVLKLAQYLREANLLLSALQASRRRIGVFLFGVMNFVLIVGALMHLIEGEENGFTSIPVSVYWAVVTLTTVGYGDISPKTPLGQFLSVIIMIVGYGVLAVPTGIVTSEMIATKPLVSGQVCPDCCREGHDHDAVHCKYCGAKLN